MKKTRKTSTTQAQVTLFIPRHIHEAIKKRSAKTYVAQAHYYRKYIIEGFDKEKAND